MKTGNSIEQTQFDIIRSKKTSLPVLKLKFKKPWPNPSLGNVYIKVRKLLRVE